MFGLIMTSVLGIGGIFSSIKHFIQNAAAKKIALRKFIDVKIYSQTYYDPFVGSDIDLFSGRKVTRKNLDWSGDEYIVDDRTGEILRNVSMIKKVDEAKYQGLYFGKRDVVAYDYGKLQRMWGEKAFNRVPGFTVGNYPKDITEIRMHCKTKKLGYKLSSYKIKGLEDKIISHIKELFGFEEIDINYSLVCLCDLFTGDLLDFTSFEKESLIKVDTREGKRDLTDYEMEEIVKRINEDFKKGVLKRKLSGWEVLF